MCIHAELPARQLASFFIFCSRRAEFTAEELEQKPLLLLTALVLLGACNKCVCAYMYAQRHLVCA